MREKSGSYLLNKQLKGQQRKVVARNLSDTRHAGILFEADSPENMDLVKELIRDLSNHHIKSQALGYIHGDRQGFNYIGDSTFSFVNKKEFNFFYKSKNELVNQFIDQPYDLLIVFCQNDYFPIKYIGNLSKSALKVGRTGLCNEMLDLMIDLSPDSTLKQLKENLLYYLGELNKPIEKKAM
jgi:hypothetical protein